MGELYREKGNVLNYFYLFLKEKKAIRTGTALQELMSQVRKGGKEERKYQHADMSRRATERWRDMEEDARTKSSPKMARKRWCDRQMEG